MRGLNIWLVNLRVETGALPIPSSLTNVGVERAREVLRQLEKEGTRSKETESSSAALKPTELVGNLPHAVRVRTESVFGFRILPYLSVFRRRVRKNHRPLIAVQIGARLDYAPPAEDPDVLLELAVGSADRLA